MGSQSGKEISLDQAKAFLVSHLGADISQVELVGEGAWSRCFGFHQGERDLVIRVGSYLDDFEKDQVAFRYASPALPIPQPFEIGRAFDGYFAISTRAYGVAWETLNAEQWQALVPSFAAALEALRMADLSGTSGWGGWGKEEKAPFDRWSEHLLSVAHDTPDRRTYGWRKRLAAECAQGNEAFAWGFDRLQKSVVDEIPRSLLHCDLINRNALVEDNQVSAIFDWGCSLYGDHLYELAWFEFWAPWYPELDMCALRHELEQRWRAANYVPVQLETRLRACYLHIGLDHLAYNAYLGDWATLLQVADQMRVLTT